MGLLLLLICFSLNWAKNCKAVKYEYKQFGVTYYGWGAKKGCVANSYSTQSKTAAEEFKLIECSGIKRGANLIDFGYGVVPDDPAADEQLEKGCNEVPTCEWRGGSCKAASCPSISAWYTCNGKFENGKCKKSKGDDCVQNDDSVYTATPENKNCYERYDSTLDDYVYDYQCPNGDCTSDYTGTHYYCDNDNPTPCTKLTGNYKRVYDYSTGQSEFVKFNSDDQKICKYKCAHPAYNYGGYGPYQYTVPHRKYCHKQLGCLFTDKGYEYSCSVWSIWAFVLTLVILILVVVAVIVAVVLFFLLGSKKKIGV